MSNTGDILARVTEALRECGIPFMLTGSFASTIHGVARTTQDIDIVIDPKDRDTLDRLAQALPSDRYYFDLDAAHEAWARRSMFNVIDHASGWKIDFILRKARPFSIVEFERRQPITVLGVRLEVASAEDTIIAKLEWSRASGGSERQRRDVRGILDTIAEALDRAHIERWVEALGLEDEWRLTESDEGTG